MRYPVSVAVAALLVLAVPTVTFAAGAQPQDDPSVGSTPVPGDAITTAMARTTTAWASADRATSRSWPWDDEGHFWSLRPIAQQPGRPHHGLARINLDAENVVVRARGDSRVVVTEVAADGDPRCPGWVPYRFSSRTFRWQITARIPTCVGVSTEHLDDSGNWPPFKAQRTFIGMTTINVTWIPFGPVRTQAQVCPIPVFFVGPLYPCSENVWRRAIVRGTIHLALDRIRTVSARSEIHVGCGDALGGTRDPACVP